MENQNGYDKYRYDGYTVYGTISSPEGEHCVEDMRTQKREAIGSQEVKTRKPMRKSGKHKGALIISAILLCFSLTVVVADILSGHSTLSDYTALFGKKSEDITSFYAVYATHSEDIGISYKNAAVIRGEGGAGYVMKQGNEYYVVVNVYEKRSDAEKIVEKNPQFAIKELSVYDFSAEADSSLAYAENSKDLYKKAYDTLYNAANRLAAKEYETTDMKSELNATRNEIATYEESFKSDLNGKEDSAGIEYKVQLKAMQSAFDNLLSHEDGLVSEARYYAAMIVHSYSLFSEKYYKKQS